MNKEEVAREKTEAAKKKTMKQVSNICTLAAI